MPVDFPTTQGFSRKRRRPGKTSSAVFVSLDGNSWQRSGGWGSHGDVTDWSWVNFESETSLRNLGWLQWSRTTDAQSPTAAEAGASTLNGYFRQGSPVFTEKVETNGNEFWRRLIKGYAPVLQERQTRCKLCRNARVGDLMLVVEEWLPCGQWDWDRIAEVIPGRDGLVQKVGSETKSTTLAGPVFRSFVCWRKRITFSFGYERNSQPSLRPNIGDSLQLWLKTPGLTMLCCTCFVCGDGGLVTRVKADRLIDWLIDDQLKMFLCLQVHLFVLLPLQSSNL